MTFSALGGTQIGDAFAGGSFFGGRRRAPLSRITLRRDLMEIGSAEPGEKDGGGNANEATYVHQMIGLGNLKRITGAKFQRICQIKNRKN